MDDLHALLIFEKVSAFSPIFSSFAPHFCQLNTGFLAIAFHIHTKPTEAHFFLIISKQKLHQPFLQCISYAFSPHTIFGLAVFAGNVNEWYGCLKDNGLVGSYGSILNIPFVTWPIFDNEIEQYIPLNIDLARYVYLITNNIQFQLTPSFEHQGIHTTLSFNCKMYSMSTHVNGSSWLPGIYIQSPCFDQILMVCNTKCLYSLFTCNS